MKKNKNMIMQTVAISLLAASISACTSESANNAPNKPVSAEQMTTKARFLASQLPDYKARGIQEEVFYFVMPDRFDNGNPANDMGSESIALSRGGFDPSNPKAFHGGDLQGLINNLDYIEQMGVSAIWLTPILRNQAQQGDISGYHGYWVLDFTQLDPHLGSNEDLRKFIDAAHAKNIKVFFDIITNHTADVIKLTECHGEKGEGWSESGQACPYRSKTEIAAGNAYTAIVPEGSENAKTPAWLNDPQYYHNQGDFNSDPEASIHGDFAGLDDLNTQDPRVVEGLTKIYKDIISEFRPDGFRIDTVKHVHLSFWQSFVPAIEAHAKSVGINNFFMFGEVWEYEPAKLAHFTTAGKLPSVLDFGLQSAIYQTLIEDKGSDVFTKLFAQDHLYKNSYELLSFTGNHDMGRFAYLLKDKRPDLSEEALTSRIKLAHAMLFLLRGVPVIYYGDEQGFVGDGNDILSRQNMFESKVEIYNDDDLIATDLTTADRNFDTEHPFYVYFAQLSSLYLKYPALRNGTQTIISSESSPGLLRFTRTNQEQSIEVVINTSDSTKNFATSEQHKAVLYPKSKVLALNETLSVAPMSFILIQN